MWDDIDAASSKTFDLADFSAAAFKFSESSTKLTEATSLYSKEGDETMESLLNEEIEKKQPEEPKFGNEKGRNLLLQVPPLRAPVLTHPLSRHSL
jgi:protein subunit release factor A